MITKEKQQEIEDKWIELVEANKFNEKTDKYKLAEFMYFQGVIAAIEYSETPPIWIICMTSGRPIASMIEKPKTKEHV